LRVGGRESRPAGGLPPARRAADPPESILLPHALHLSRDCVSLRAPLPRRSRAAYRRSAARALWRAVREPRFRGPPPLHRQGGSLRSAGPRAPPRVRRPPSRRARRATGPAREGARSLLRADRVRALGVTLPMHLAGERSPQLPLRLRA